MAAPIEQAIGTMPDVKSRFWPNWALRAWQVRLGQYHTDHGLTYTTYYVDAQGGDDANAGTSGAPWATLAKIHSTIALAPNPANLLFLIKHGSVFRERGADYVWLSTDGGHDAAIYCNKDNVVLGSYGDPADGNTQFIVDDRVLPASTTTWTQGGAYPNIWYTDTTAINDLTYDHVFTGGGDELTALTRVTSVSDCNNTSNSFYYDAVTPQLILNVGGDPASVTGDVTLIPRNHLSCFRLEGDNNVILGGTSTSRWQGFGWGYDLADKNSHDYFVSIGVEGTDAAYVRNIEAYYTSTHAVATWHPGASGKSGGISVWHNVGGGLTMDNTGERLINGYMPGGGHEFWVIDCEATHGTVVAPNSPVQTVGGHSDCHIVFYWGNTGSVSFSNAAAIGIFNVFGNQLIPDNGNAVNINCQRTWMKNSDGTMTTQFFTADFINCLFTLDADTSKSGLTSTGGDGDFLNCQIDGLMTSSVSRTGMHWTIANGGEATPAWKFKGCLVQKHPDSTGGTLAPMTGNVDEQIDCGFFDVPETGYNAFIDSDGRENAVNPTIMSAYQTYGAEAASELVGAMSEEYVGYDALFRARHHRTKGSVEAGILTAVYPVPASISELDTELVSSEAAHAIAEQLAGVPLFQYRPHVGNGTGVGLG